MADVLYEDSTFKFTVQYFDSDQTTKIPASSVGFARYSLFNGDTCELTKTLGDGITVVGEDFEVTINKGELTKYGSTFTHQFSVGDADTSLEPPIFNNAVQVIKVNRC